MFQTRPLLSCSVISENCHCLYDPSYLDISRTDGIIIIQITLNEGRTTELKKNFYQAVADGLHKELGIRSSA